MTFGGLGQVKQTHNIHNIDSVYKDLISVKYFCTGVDNSIQRFLESARQMESFFLDKRLVLSVAKPENVLNEVLPSCHSIKSITKCAHSYGLIVAF